MTVVEVRPGIVVLPLTAKNPRSRKVKRQLFVVFVAMFCTDVLLERTFRRGTPNALYIRRVFNVRLCFLCFLF